MLGKREKNKQKLGGLHLYGGDMYGVYGSSTRGNMIYGKEKKRKWPIVLVLLFVVVAAFFIVRMVLANMDVQRQQEEQAVNQAQQEQQAVEQATSGFSGTIKISAVGDMTLGTDSSFDASTSFNTTFSSNSPDYFLKRVSSYFQEDQLTLANFEGTLTTSTDRQDKTYAFKGDANYTEVLTSAGIGAVNMANNHSYDYGEQGYTDTIAALDAAKIKNFGDERTTIYETNGVKIGLFGINAVERSAEIVSPIMLKDIATLKTEGCNIVIGSFHWGTEGDYSVDETQTTLAHAAIDAGCDLVLGTHPHVLQGIEKYKDRYICYSLGNFCFGGNTNPKDFNTMIYQQTFTLENGELVVNDETLQQMDVVPCSVSSTTSINNYQPMPLSGEDATSLLQKLNGYSQSLAGSTVLVSEELDAANLAKVQAESAKSTGSVSKAAIEAARLNALGESAETSSSASGTDSTSAGEASASGASGTDNTNAGTSGLSASNSGTSGSTASSNGTNNSGNTSPASGSSSNIKNSSVTTSSSAG